MLGRPNADILAEPVRAPDFRLPDSEGRMVHLSDYNGKKHVVLVFNRSMF
jgi:peroxiredoxin